MATKTGFADKNFYKKNTVNSQCLSVHGILGIGIGLLADGFCVKWAQFYLK